MSKATKQTLVDLCFAVAAGVAIVFVFLCAGCVTASRVTVLAIPQSSGPPIMATNTTHASGFLLSVDGFTDEVTVNGSRTTFQKMTGDVQMINAIGAQIISAVRAGAVLAGATNFDLAGSNTVAAVK